MTQTFNLDLMALTSCAPAMSKDELRVHLYGVHIFEREGELIYEATDGHILVQVSSDIPQDELDFAGLNIILPSFVVKELIKKSFQKGFGVENPDFQTSCHIDNNRINIEMFNGLINFKLVDGIYPNTAQAIPEHASCKNNNLSFDQLGFNILYMDKIYKSAKVFDKSGVIRMAFSDENQGAILIKSSEPAWTAVLMPCKI